MITPDQSNALKDYFPVKSHEFLNGNTYITEEAITNRLDEVDPSWQFKKLEVRREGSTVTAIYCLMVCGVERDGVGMATVQLNKDKDREVNEAEKSAATDALKRCARLFGIGRYILEMGKSVSDYRSLEQWLIQRSNVTPLNSHQEARTDDLARASGDFEPAMPKGARTPQQALNGNGAPAPGEKKTVAPKVELPNWKTDLGKVYTEVRKFYKADAHMKNSIAALETAGKLTDDMTVDLAIRAIINHKDELEAPF